MPGRSLPARSWLAIWCSWLASAISPTSRSAASGGFGGTRPRRSFGSASIRASCGTRKENGRGSRSSWRLGRSSSSAACSAGSARTARAAFDLLIWRSPAKTGNRLCWLASESTCWSATVSLVLKSMPLRQKRIRRASSSTKPSAWWHRRRPWRQSSRASSRTCRWMARRRNSSRCPRMKRPSTVSTRTAC